MRVSYQLHKPFALSADFEVRGFTALLGRSGTGKTSLLRALAGLTPATGTPWGGLKPEQRPIGYLPQQTGLFPHLTALANTAYPLRGKDRLVRAKALLAALGLEHLGARYPAQLSGGEAQRIALARALAHEPDMLLLDEPSAALDAVTRDATLDWLISVTSARGVPVLAATHDPMVAQRANWVVLMAGGRVIQQGSAWQVFSGPASHAAAELLGYENIITLAGRLVAIRAADIGIASAGIPATILNARETGAGLWLECAMPERVVVHPVRGALTDFCPGAIIHLTLPADKQKPLA